VPPARGPDAGRLRLGQRIVVEAPAAPAPHPAREAGAKGAVFREGGATRVRLTCRNMYCFNEDHVVVME
jgi:hypothetical protein